MSIVSPNHPDFSHPVFLTAIRPCPARAGKGGAKASSGLHGDDADDDDDDEEAMHARMGGGMPGGAQCRQM